MAECLRERYISPAYRQPSSERSQALKRKAPNLSNQDNPGTSGIFDTKIQRLQSGSGPDKQVCISIDYQNIKQIGPHFSNVLNFRYPHRNFHSQYSFRQEMETAVVLPKLHTMEDTFCYVVLVSHTAIIYKIGRIGFWILRVKDRGGQKNVRHSSGSLPPRQQCVWDTSHQTSGTGLNAWGFPTAYVHAFAVHHSTTPTGAKAGSWLLRIRYWLALVSQPFHLSWELPTQLLE